MCIRDRISPSLAEKNQDHVTRRAGVKRHGGAKRSISILLVFRSVLLVDLTQIPKFGLVLVLVLRPR